MSVNDTPIPQLTPGSGSGSLAVTDPSQVGSISSVALSMPGEFSVAGSPITSTGTFAVTWQTQSANTVLAGPTSGAAATPAFRALVSADIPGGGGTGTVTSVGLTMPSILSVSGSPITTSGTFTVTLATQFVNTVFAGPASGGSSAPTFRSLVAADIPTLSYISSVVGGTGVGVSTSAGTATVSIGQDVSTSSGVLFANLTVTGTLTYTSTASFGAVTSTFYSVGSHSGATGTIDVATTSNIFVAGGIVYNWS